MKAWAITWFDGSSVRVTLVHSDPYNLMNFAQNAGVYNLHSIIKIEQVPQ